MVLLMIVFPCLKLYVNEKIVIIIFCSPSCPRHYFIKSILASDHSSSLTSPSARIRGMNPYVQVFFFLNVKIVIFFLGKE